MVSQFEDFLGGLTIEITQFQVNPSIYSLKNCILGSFSKRGSCYWVLSSNGVEFRWICGYYWGQGDESGVFVFCEVEEDWHSLWQKNVEILQL